MCPTGIDIRDGQQLECIGCGLCIDACDEVMDKVGRQSGLIAFDTLAAQQAAISGQPHRHPWIRPRPMIYLAIMVVVAAVMVTALALRGDTELHVLRDRAPLFVTLSDGSIRNGYTIKILNKARADRDYTLTVDGLAGAALTVVGAATHAPAARVSLVARPDSVATYRVYVAAPKAAQDSVAITFRLSGAARGAAASQASSFVSPKR